MINRKRAAGLVYPFPVCLDKVADFFGSRAPRHDDFYLASREDLDRQAFRPGAQAHRKARHLVGLVIGRRKQR